MTVLRVKSWVGAVAGLAATLGVAGCSRDHIKAVELSNAADQVVSVNVAGAIQKYEEATRLDPTNHRIFWKLAGAYQKQEEWDKMASTLSRAVQVAPEFANYWYRDGYALMRLAEAGNKDAYEEAKAPLKSCIEKDPQFAECYHWLGEALLWTGDENGAIANYTKAVQQDPTVGYFYAPLADLYIALKFYDEAEKLLTEGTRLVPPTDKSRDHLYNMYTLLSVVYQAKDDSAKRLTVLEKADGIGGETHPENAFNLGSTYAVMGQKEKALRLLSSFNKKACRSNKGQKAYKAQCEQSATLVQELGSQ